MFQRVGYNRGMVKLKCEQCGKSFAAKNYQRASRRFCASGCYGKWQRVHRGGFRRRRIDVRCTTCGKTIERQPCQSKTPRNHFCDRKCWARWRSSPAWCGANNLSWRGGHVEYRGQNWRAQSRACRERDGNRCQRCGATGKRLPVHHRTPFRLFTDYRDANRLDNLITLCPRCHGIEEIRFWKLNPGLAKTYPLMRPATTTCKKCGESYVPRSPQSRACDPCCSRPCDWCGAAFYNRRIVNRKAKYCSRRCFAESMRHKSPLSVKT